MISCTHDTNVVDASIGEWLADGVVELFAGSSGGLRMPNKGLNQCDLEG